MEKLSGFLLVDKPAGWTSFDVCAKLRKILDTKRIGHTGTLDPFATGLLLIAFGKATRLIPFLEKEKKKYRTKILFGKTSETLDPESKIIESGKKPELSQIEEIEKILKNNFFGKIQQTPPKYSALKINGERAYHLARKGESFEMHPRETEIFSIKILAGDADSIELEMQVAAGFYIRSFARDLAEKLGTIGMCQTLRRNGIGKLSIDDQPVINEEFLRSNTPNIENFIIKPTQILNLPQIEIPPNRLADFCGGRAVEIVSGIPAFPFKNYQKILVLEGEKTVGIGEIFGKNLQPRISLLNQGEL